MASPAQRIIDEAVLHRIALARYSTWTVRRVLAVLNRTDADLVARILRADNEGRDPVQLERLLEEVRALQADGWTVVRSRLGDDLAGLAAAERDFSARIVRYGRQATGLGVATGIPTTAQVVAAANARPFQGRFLRDWLRDAEEGAARRTREVIRQGFIEGRSAADIARQIRGTRANQYRDGVLEVSRRGAEAMVRTANGHYASVAARETYQAMGVTSIRFIATLDSRTTLTCAGLHNTVHPLEKFPWPPRHINCRSTASPEIDGLPPIEAPSYEDWLRRQPLEVQNDVLGVGKARLFREGKLSLDRFVDRKGRELTLDQLRAAANLDPQVRFHSLAGLVSDGEYAALRSYTGSGYAAINGALRGAMPMTGEVRDHIAHLDELLSRSRLPAATTLWRGVGADAVEPYRSIRVGSIVWDQAFASTSRDRSVADDFVRSRGGGLLFRISAPAGYPALDVSRESTTGAWEREVLLPRGRRWEVIGLDYGTGEVRLRPLG